MYLMKKTSFGSKFFGAGNTLKMLFSGMVLMLLVGIQGVQGQVSNTLQASVPGGNAGVDAVVNVGTKSSAQALINADLIDQQDAITLIRSTTVNLVTVNQAAQDNPGSMPPAVFATNAVKISYHSHLYNSLLTGGELYEVLGSSFSYLSGIVAQQNPAHGIDAMAIYQETLDLLTID
jgi:hypothetical protein